MIEALCTETCYSGVLFFTSGKTYLIDETKPFFRRHFDVPAKAEESTEEVEDIEEPEVEQDEPPETIVEVPAAKKATVRRKPMTRRTKKK